MPSRRSFVATAGVALAALAGCPGDGTEETPVETQTTRRTTESTEATTETTDSSPDRSEDDTKYDRVVIENRTDEEQVAWVRVERDGDVLHEGTYRAPPNTGLRVQRKFDWGTHAVSASVDDGDRRAHEWDHGSCANTPHPNGNENLGVVVESGAWSFVTNGCDYLKLGETYVQSYEPANEHEVESTTTSQ